VFSMPQHNTLRVYKQTPRVSTFCVQSKSMKSVGERIRQAREARQMSGEALAKKVGYKHQSAIGNLENRSTGTGGNKISEIAEVLEVPLQWLMSGPDTDEVPTIGSQPLSQPISSPRRPAAREADSEYSIFLQATALLEKLDRAGKLEAIEFLKYLAAKRPMTIQSDRREDHSLPRTKAA
jgi:transcriptional regulator with XRE-family HTH domain